MIVIFRVIKMITRRKSQRNYPRSVRGALAGGDRLKFGLAPAIIGPKRPTQGGIKMRGPILTAFVFCFFLLSSCSASRTSTINVPSLPTTPPGSKVLIMPIADGVERKEGPAQGSGKAVMFALRDALLSHGFKAFISEIRNLQEAFVEASKLFCQYVLKGDITEWEDNATPWSGKPDAVSLSVEIYDSKKQECVGTVSHRVAGAPFDFLERTPDRFYPELADATLGPIFGWKPTILTEK